MNRQNRRSLAVESLECRRLLDAASLEGDITADGRVDFQDFVELTGKFNQDCDGCAADLDGSGKVDFRDFLVVARNFGKRISAGEVASSGSKSPGILDGTYAASFNQFEQVDDPNIGARNLLTEADVETLLDRAELATDSSDAIIAVVDRAGRILGVRVEPGAKANFGDPDKLAFAIDGAVAKARTAAFFSSNAAPLTSRTIRFISQSTITQREVESSPTHDDPRYKGPGLVAPIGVGGHFPPEIPFTPQVDLFAIEHQSRDSQTHPGADGIKGNGDDFELNARFNADLDFVPAAAEEFFATWPESFGEQSGISPNSIPRGIGTLPGGVPLYKLTRKLNDRGEVVPFNPGVLSESINLVGGIGVFFPGEDGFATFEQGFERGVGQSERARNNAAKVIEAEFTAFIAAAGGGLVAGDHNFNRDVSRFNDQLPFLPDFVLPVGRIDLVGITLEIYGPTPSREFRQPGIDRLLYFGDHSQRAAGLTGEAQLVDGVNEYLAGQRVPEGWLVAPHDSENGPLTEADVRQIIETGVKEAERTRAAIRLNIDNRFRPGVPTRMVLAVADTDGDLLGLYRMPDATIFSIDVSVAKARNTAYYADPVDLVAADRVDFNDDGTFGDISNSIHERNGDTFPLGTALTNRSFRFLAEPRFPTGIELPPGFENQITDSSAHLCENTSGCVEVGPHSMLRLPGINPVTAENLEPEPFAFDVYASATHGSTVAFDSFNVMRNFRDPGDATVVIEGPDTDQPLANQNGVVFFPGSTPLYVNGRTSDDLAGGFGVSGDGVDQDDVVTSAGQQGFDPLQSIRIDSFTIGAVRPPFQHFNRNPFGA